MNDQIIITIIYEPSSGDVGVSVTKLGVDKNVNLKDVLMALHAAEGQYLGQLQVSELPDDAPPAVEEESDNAANDRKRT